MKIESQHSFKGTLQKEGALPIMESFLTLQGEGTFQGASAFFIRTAGCDVGCVWCDVKESWGLNANQFMDTEELVSQAVDSKAPIAVITGGEPAMWDLAPITKSLMDKGIRVHIETSGVHPLTGDWHWICLSPKKFKPTTEEIHARADELKVVVYHKSDFQFAEEHAQKVGPDCKLYLQPEWGRVNQMAPLIVDYIKENPQWRISLQSHKYLNIP